MNNEGNREGAETENNGEEGDMLIKKGGTQAEAGIMEVSLCPTPLSFPPAALSFPSSTLDPQGSGKGHVTQIQPITAAHPTLATVIGS